MKRYSGASADRMVQALIRVAQDEAMAGADHPDLREWHTERLAAAKQRLVLRLMGDHQAAERIRLPERPEIDYDR